MKLVRSGTQSEGCEVPVRPGKGQYRLKGRSAAASSGYQSTLHPKTAHALDGVYDMFEK